VEFFQHLSTVLIILFQIINWTDARGTDTLESVGDVAILLILGLAAGSITTVAGIGGGMLLVLVLAMTRDPVTALAITAPALFLGNIHRLIMFRRSIDTTIVRKFVIGALPGAVLGAIFAAALPPSFIRWTLAAMVGVSILTAWRMPTLQLNRGVMLPAGVFIGGLTGTSGGAGILTAPVLLAMNLSGEAFVATISACVSVMHVGRFVGYGAAGFITPGVLADSAVVAVAILAGNFCGKRLRPLTQRIPGRTLEYSVLVACATFALVGFAD
jgi:uncharacterized protein